MPSEGRSTSRCFLPISFCDGILGAVSVLTLPVDRLFRPFPLSDGTLGAVSVLSRLVDGAGPAQNGAGPGPLARVCFLARDPRHGKSYNGDLRRRSPNYFRTCASNGLLCIYRPHRRLGRSFVLFDAARTTSALPRRPRVGGAILLYFSDGYWRPQLLRKGSFNVVDIPLLVASNSDFSQVVNLIPLASNPSFCRIATFSI